MASAPGGKKFDVFLVHRSEDNYLADQITKGLTARGLKVYTDFQFGKSIIDNIIHGLEHSKTILILLTKNLLDSDWVKFEVKLALDKSVSENVMCLRLILNKITEEEKKKFADGTVLERIPAVNLDFNKESWIDELLENINAEMLMPELLPGGNVSLGIVFNYFSGFVRHILPGIRETIEKSECYAKANNRMLTKFVFITPNSCQVQPIEGTYGDYVISKEGSLKITSKHGDKVREYNPAIYKIEKAGCDPFFFVADCPFILNTLYKMKKEGLVNVDIQFQVAGFRTHLMDIIEHKQNGTFNGTSCFVEYDDKAKLAEDIWLKMEEMAAPSAEHHSIAMRKGKRPEQKGQYFVTVMNAENTHDNELSTIVQQHLEANDVKFNGMEGKPDYLHAAEWNIFIISEEGVKDESFLLWYHAAISNSVSNNEIKVIPILRKGTNVSTLPLKIRWTLLLKQDDEDYLEKMMKIMNGEKQKMMEMTKAGNVNEGLAYAYLFNYLPFTLVGKTETGRDFMERFLDAKQKYKVDCPCVPRMMVIIPRSCKFPAPGSVVSEEHLGPIEPVKIAGRSYFLQMYRLTLSTGEKVCYAREYATPAIAMLEMVEDYPFAGLSQDEMFEQVQKFATFCQTIAENQLFKDQYGDITSRCTFLYVDDREKTVHEMLEETLLKCLEQGELL